MNRVTGFLILTGVSMLAACASQPPASTGSATSTASAATSTGAPVIPYGYSREIVDGSEMYCRDDLDTGSRVQRTKVCLTWDQLQAQERSKLNVHRGSSPLD